MRTPPLASRLTAWACVVPLVVLSAMAWLSSDIEPQWAQHTLTYGAVVLSFMGGARWGYALKAVDGKSNYLELGAALLPGAIGWISLFAIPLYGAALQITAFLFQAVWDLLSSQTGRLPAWAVRVRMEMTGAAVLTLLALTAAIIAQP